MTDYSTTLHPDLAGHAQAFFAALPEVPSSPVIMAGVYLANEGTSFEEQGVDKQTTYKLRIAAPNGTREGDVVRFGSATLAGAEVRETALLTLEDRGDAGRGDDADALKRLLAPYGSEGEGWATAIAGASDREQRFGKPIADIDGVPSGTPNDDEVVMVAYLMRHFTYDENGAYYEKWKEPQLSHRRRFPRDLKTSYKEKAVLEHKLDRDNFYCYSVLTGEANDAGSYPATESVVRIRLNPNGTTAELETIYSVNRREDEARAEFCFFYAHAGINISVPPSARGTLSPDLAVLRLDRPLSELLSELRATTHAAVLDATNTKLKVSGIIRTGATLSTLPEGVELISGRPERVTQPEDADTSGDEEDAYADRLQDNVRVFLCPPDKLVALAAHDDLLVLNRVARSAVSNTTARTTIGHAGFATDIGATPVGTDVFIGVVDSGIDGNHPAFAGRIHKVWDQTASANASHPPPTGRGNGFGQVWDSDAEIQASATDELGHGTHVAGTAAGATGTGYTETGMAPAAKLLIVKTDFDNDNIRRGVQWCFREAGNKPCVVNLSLQSTYHGHDGVDDFSLSLRGTFRKRNRGSAGYHWTRGRVLCVAAGNAGDSAGHTHVTPLAENATADMPVIVRGAGIASTRITLFAYPLPRAARSARIDVRIRRGTGAAAAASKWFTYVATGATDSDIVGGTQVDVVNGPTPRGDSMGLAYTQHQRVELFLTNTSATGIPTGTWTVEVRSRTTEDIQVDAYVFDAVWAGQGHPVFFRNATKRSIIMAPGTVYGAVAVGALVNRSTWTAQGLGAQTTQTPTIDPTTNLTTANATSTVGDVAHFSCPGPIRGSRRTLRVMAPGEGVLSAMSNSGGTRGMLFSATDVVDANTGQMGGTSMACPVATGVVAGMLGKHPTLTAKQIIDRLASAVKAQPAGWDAELHGPGPLDASKALD